MKANSNLKAYVSCITDEKCVTVTASAGDETSLIAALKAVGARVKKVDITGRFHRLDIYSDAALKLTKITKSTPGLQFPAASELKLPLRSNATGELITEEISVTNLAIESILLRTADWYGTVRQSLACHPTSYPSITTLAFNEAVVPTSLMQGQEVNGMQHIDHGVTNGHNGNGAINGLKGTPHSKRILNGAASKSVSSPTGLTAKYPSHAVAVIGMAGRFPGADDVDKFWDLLASGVSMVREAPKERLPLHGQRLADRPMTTFWGNFIEDPESFDHRFFKKSSREAVSWDPEKRVLLQVVYEALEAAGHWGPLGQTASNDYGCYMGVVANNYYDNVACHPPNAYSMLGTSRAFYSGRISHQFGFTGPAMSIDTACSSSLVAINAACKAIQAGECTRAVAGGTNIFTSPYDYQNLAAAGFLSPSGGCKPFDASADGYCRGEGVAAVVLKSLDQAIAEGDNVLGVIVGSAVNQNHNDAHITVPCASSQTTVFKKVLDMAGVEPSEVSYVEAHGTGTQIGDPIEVQSIRDTFGGADRKDKLFFGSVKGHIGHTEASAGVSGLIKVLLMLQHQSILGQTGFSKLNPKIPALAPDMMEVPTKVQPWAVDNRLACVNSYGAAGSNAAVAVQEAGFYANPEPSSRRAAAAKQPFFLSAASKGSLSAYAERLLERVTSLKASSKDESGLLSDVLFHLADRGNHTLAYTVAKNVTDFNGLQQILDDIVSGKEEPLEGAGNSTPPVIMVFSGQEKELVGLSQAVIDCSSLFKKHLDVCNFEAARLGIEDLHSALTKTQPINELPTLHAALFASQYATAQTWIDSGLTVRSLVGHSFGQLTALCVAGSLSVQDALTLVIQRARLIQKLWGKERGAMISVQADRAAVEDLISKAQSEIDDGNLEIACYNHSTNHVVVGTTAAIDVFEKTIAAQPSMKAKRLNVTHGFHSELSEPLLPSLAEIARGLRWHKPTIHVELTTEAALGKEPGAWLVPEHTRKGVFFSSAVERLSEKHGSALWVEAGAGSSVLSLVKNTVSGRGNNVLAPSFLNNATSAVASVAETVVEMWKAGVSVQYWPYHRSQRSSYAHLSLPPYQFEKTKHWLPFVEPTATESAKEPAVEPTPRIITHQFLSLLENDEGKKESLFLVDPESKRYMYLLNGHIASNQALAPASLYVELLSLATLKLVEGSSYDTHVTNMDGVKMVGAPIGLDAKKNIFIRLKRRSDALNYWEFEFFSKSKAGDEPPQTHTLGNVGLDRRDDPLLKETIIRWSALIDYNRCLSLMKDDTTESMSGKHIYIALQRLIYFDEMYHGIKSIAYQGHHAAGKVAATLDPSLDPKFALYDTPTIDGMMQFAGVLVNYFAHPSGKEVLLCQGIQRVVTGGSFDIAAKEWIAYSLLTEDSDERTVADVYIFDKKSKQVVIAFMGFIFTRTSVSMLQRSLRSVNSGGAPAPAAAPALPLPKPTAAAGKASNKPSNKPRIYEIISSVTDVPVEELADSASLEDLGIDSLLVTEVLNEIHDALGLEIDLNDFLFFPTLGHVCQWADSALGSGGDAESPEVPAAADSVAAGKEVTATAANGDTSRPPLIEARQVFADCKSAYSDSTIDTGAASFWSNVYPEQAALVLAYVAEAFAKLGCDMTALSAGAEAPQIYGKTLDRHAKLVAQYYKVLEDGGYLEDGAGKLVRTSKPVDTTPANTLYEKIIPKWPQHANVHKIVQAVGSQLAACLTGEADGLQIVFGNKENKKALDDLYENWPLVRSGSVALGSYLETLFSKSIAPAKYRILEVGAGTGGTTRYIVRHLQKLGIPFEYVFTDLSASLIAQAKRTFKDCPEMEFATLDIEKEPPEKWVNDFHIIISTNCIHATHDLTVSLSSLRKLLRDDGALTLVEITQNMFWLDIAVGLFEGWWLMEDGRTHAVTHQDRWKKDMLTAGFADVDWTDGPDKEAQTIRVIAGFASK